MGWESTSVFQVLIVQGSTGSGVFVYSPSPGAGNLIASIAAAGGTDHFGNVYRAGIVSYSAAGASIAELVAGQVQFGQAADPTLGSLVSSAGVLNLISSTTGVADSVGEITIYSKNASPSGAPLLRAGHFEALLSSQFDLGLTVTGGLTADTETITGSVAGAPMLQVTDAVANSNPAVRVQAANAINQLFFGGLLAGDTNNRLVLRVDASSNAEIAFGPGNGSTDSFITRAAAHLLAVNGADLDVNTVGRGLRVAEGTNAKQGTAVLVAGVVTVANTSVTANSRIFTGCAVPGGTPGGLFVSAITAGTGFTIKSTSGGDTSTVAYEIIEPG